MSFFECYGDFIDEWINELEGRRIHELGIANKMLETVEEFKRLYPKDPWGEKSQNFLNLMFETCKLEKIILEAIKKKNLELLDPLMKKLREIEMSKMELSEEASNEGLYLSVCNYSKRTFELYNKICYLFKNLNSLGETS